MFESQVSALALYYAEKYIANLRPSDLKLSLWGELSHNHEPFVYITYIILGGDVVLKNLELRLDGWLRPKRSCCHLFSAGE